MTEALAGIRVLDFTQNLAGPTCTQALADLGADVIKIEPPAGDSARDWGPPFRDGAATIFRSANHGKRSVVLDLSGESGRAAARTLAEESDVLVEAFRPGVMARLGLDAETLLAADPALIYVSISAYGERGPLGTAPGFDALMQAHAGLVSVTGRAGDPVRAGTSVVDTGTALWAAIGVLSALRDRDRTGRGGHLRVALFEAALAYNAYHIAGYLASGDVPEPRGNAFPLIAPYGQFEARDGPIVIAPANDRLFRRLCEVLRLEGIADQERFAANPDRVANRDAIDAIVSRAIAEWPVGELLEALRAAGIPCAPVHDIGEVCDDPQTREAGPLHGDRILPPFTWNGSRPAAARPVPALGEHTRDLVGGADGDT